MKVANYIRYEGWVDREKLPEIYNKADFFVMPSRDEGMPNAIGEAMASGLPVITTDIPGCMALVKDGENGFIVPRGKNGDPDVKKLAKAFTTIIHDPGLRSRMGLKSGELSEKFSWTITAEKFLESFGNV